MTKAEKEELKAMLEKKVEAYFEFVRRDDYPDKPCVRRAVDILQNTVFNLAEIMWHMKVITWEECCEYWAKVGLVDEDAKCKFTNCGANIDGNCEYALKRGNRQ